MFAPLNVAFKVAYIFIFPFSAAVYSSAGKESKQHSSLLLLNKELPRTTGVVTVFLAS